MMANNKFIYVFSEEERDKLLAMGLPLLKRDERTHTYIFENTSGDAFDESSAVFVFSDVLTF